MAARVCWVVEPSVFGAAYRWFMEAIEGAGHELVLWDEEATLESVSVPKESSVVFHGSLGTAAMIYGDGRWTPGAFCDVEGFLCSRWYSRAVEWLLVDRWVFATVAELAADPRGVAGEIGGDGEVFVRPNSPLKPFSGRRCSLDGLSLEALDYGFYYDDLETAVVVAPVRSIEREWRFVVVGGKPVAASGYAADGRTAVEVNDAPWEEAARIAAEFDAPEEVYVLDLCLSEGRVRLLEINPFSGADLYSCCPRTVVEAVSEAALARRG